MTISYVSAAHENSVGPLLKGLKNLMRPHSCRAQGPDGSHIRRILQPAHASQVSPCIGAPVTQKTDYRWFEVFAGHPDSPSLSTETYRAARANSSYAALKQFSLKIVPDYLLTRTARVQSARRSVDSKIRLIWRFLTGMWPRSLRSPCKAPC